MKEGIVLINRNSIFIRILIPVTAIMLLQTLLISLVLFMNGTMQTLEGGAVKSLVKNAENRQIILENLMVHSWSNIDSFETDIKELIDDYLRENNITIDEVIGDAHHENNLLYNFSDTLIEALRLNQSTGTFIYFCDNSIEESERKFMGLYYRNLDPLTITSDNSDLLFLRGPINIARKHKIQLDSFWGEVFTFSPELENTWECYTKTIEAANAMPKLSSSDLSFWSSPLYINEFTAADSNECITYNRPLFYNGTLIAVIGTEIQINWIKRYFPETDFDRNGMGGYMLVTYDESDGDVLTSCEVKTLTGSYLKRLISEKDVLSLKKGYNDSLYSVTGNNGEKAQLSFHPIKLYNEGTPFENIKWALVSIETDNFLFSASESVKIGIISSSVTALIIGVVLISFMISMITRPLLTLAHNIMSNETDAIIEIGKTKIYEVVLLGDTINAMRIKRQQMEYKLREERERYLVALECVTDTFAEYDMKRDCFMVYYFTTYNQKPILSSHVIDNFISKVENGDICSEDTISVFIDILRGEHISPAEIRFKPETFKHIDSALTDEGYLWFLFRASYTYDKEGNIGKIIGTAKHITDEKLKEKAKTEAMRRDPTTGLYNRYYGIEHIDKLALSAERENCIYAVCVVSIGNFSTIEAYYGRVFGGMVMNSLSSRLSKLISDDDLIIRAGNDDFICFFPGTDENSVREKAARIIDAIRTLYIGENQDLHIEAHLGAALSDNCADSAKLITRAYNAAALASNQDESGIVVWDESTDYGDDKHRIKPVSIDLEITRETISSFASDAFERTVDIPSVINALLSILGDLFDMRQIVICLYDYDFEAYQVDYQWNSGSSEFCNRSIIKIPRVDFNDLRRLLDKAETIVFNTESIKDKSDGIKNLLCMSVDETVNALGYALFENGVHSGMVIYKSSQTDRVWTDAEKYTLGEVTRVISARISIQKSHTASKAKSEFLSRMSHEIRTPMNAIIGMTNIAKENSSNIDFVKDCLNKIQFSSKHLLSLINDVLDMSRIESGKLEMENKPFSLHVLSETIEMLMRQPIENKQITFSIDNKCTHKSVLGDEYRLRQVLVNLIGNSLKFTEAGGEIRFIIEELSSENANMGLFKFTVKDNGIGISKEDQPRIFKSFEQVSRGEAHTNSVGTGLGLSISSNIINSMGGNIDVISSLGRGSEFFFTLEMQFASDAQPEKQDGDEFEYEGKFKGKRVLLVEDNEINIEIASYILEVSGLEVEVALNGNEAVEKFNSSDEDYYDAIIMDIQMPIMDGLTATRKIRKNEKRNDASKVPIIAMSANAFDEDMKKSIDSGMNGHIAKPIDNTQLFTLLRDLIGFSDYS